MQQNDMQHSNTKRNIKGNTIKQEEHLHTLFNASRLVSQVHVLIDLLLTIKNIKALLFSQNAIYSVPKHITRESYNFIMILGFKEAK